MVRKATRRTTAKRGAKKKTSSRSAKKTTARKSSSRKTAAKKKTASKAKSTRVVKAAPKPKPVVKAKKATKPKNQSTLSYTQSEFLENIRAFCGLEKKAQAKEMWEDVSNFITDALNRGYRVPLVNLGKMYVRKSKARMGRNPATGEIIHISAKKRVRFTAAKALKDSVL